MCYQATTCLRRSSPIWKRKIPKLWRDQNLGEPLFQVTALRHSTGERSLSMWKMSKFQQYDFCIELGLSCCCFVFKINLFHAETRISNSTP
ncbi:hypothetical protein Y032_0237g3250 [Ancylostoma ceylanicum]|uniref:Uncharacterized protein n=1 Tax=Ancylostoma ceylanicum TaxID=53326 RepID=A0A016SFE6_9BILA|nr:hypothetical protein Y032_0237g3250 [Ancylostoma ceylanicum]